MKYIIVEIEGVQVAKLFHQVLQHKTEAGSHKVISAGHCDQYGAVWGGSPGLGLNCRPVEDSEIIRRTMEFKM